MGHSFTTSYLSASCLTAKRSIYLSPWVVSRHNLQPWQAGSNVLNLPLSRVHQMPYNNNWTSSKLLFWPKKNFLPPDLIVIKWVTVQHICRTFKYKDLHNEQNPHEILVQQVLDLWAVVFSSKPSWPLSQIPGCWSFHLSVLVPSYRCILLELVAS